MGRCVYMIVLALACFALLLTCAPGCGEPSGESPPPDAVTSSESAGGFTVRLTVAPQVTAPGKDFSLKLEVANESGADRTFEFPSSQMYDFVAVDGEGDDVWRWSEDKKFSQMMTRRTIEAGETVSFDESWTTLSALQGDFLVTGYYLGLEAILPTVEVKITAGEVI